VELVYGGSSPAPGEVRLELSGRFSIESFFPGWKQGDAMNITLVPSSSEPEKERRGKPTEARSISFGERWSW
jgi:hypothetical protein